ncbi:alpha/beta hydrolase-fold protein [Hymenobacter sedentarius]|nr:alpha/beta hydrolase-fold protein [Hymenobacter sedentarius]
MKQLLFLLLLVGPALAQAQTVKNGAIVIGQVDSLRSTVLNEQRKVWVSMPASASFSTLAKQRYPVVYLLDGASHFAYTADIIQRLSAATSSVFPEMIVVGITNTQRTRDLTTSRPTSVEDMSAEELKTAGGAENFTAFIEKELIPYIEAHYPASAHRTLIGHSFGGLLVMNTLVHHATLFENYVALDPSMWWDGGKLLQEVHEAFAQPRFQGRTLFVASANTTGLDSVLAAKDPSVDGQHTRAKWKLRQDLARNKSNGLRSAYRYYPTDTHSLVTVDATYDALRYIFQSYMLSPAEYSTIFADKPIEAAAKLVAHYQRVSARVGYPVLPPEPLVTRMGYNLLPKSGQAPNALALFQLNLQNYPASPSAHAAMGYYYEAQKQPDLAIASYTRSLQLKETPALRKRLDQLQAKK